MSIINSDSMRMGAAAQGGSYLINQSIRFNDDDSAYMYRTPSVAGNRKTWTWAGWVKRGNLGSYQYIWSDNSSAAAAYGLIAFNANDKLDVQWVNSTPATEGQLVTSAVHRDVGAWYHIVFVADTTNATAGNRMRLWVNGEEVTAFDTDQNPSLNFDTETNNTNLHALAKPGWYDGVYLDGYLADVHFIDGAALTAASFGETDIYGNWVPIEFTGATTTDFIPGATGTTIGDMVTGGGLAAATDGNKAQTYLTGCAGNTTTGPTDWVGKDYSAEGGKTVTKALLYATTSQGFNNDGNTARRLKISLKGSATGAWAGEETVLDSHSFGDNGYTAHNNEILELTPSTPASYDYYQFFFEDETATNMYACISEMEFFEAGTGYGTNGFHIDGADSSDLGADVSGNNSLSILTGGTPTHPIGSGTAANFNDQDTTTITSLTSIGDLTGAGFDARKGLQIDFGSNKTIHTLAILNTYTTAYSVVNTFYYSTNGTSWTVWTGTAPNITTVSGNYTSEATIPVTARYVCINYAAANVGAAQPIIYGEFQAWTADECFTTSGLTTADQMLDSPTDDAANVVGNYAVLNVLHNVAGSTVADGNLVATSGTSAYRTLLSTIGMTSGKFACVASPSAAAGNWLFGIQNKDAAMASGNYPGIDANGYGYFNGTGDKYNNGGAAYGNTYTNGDSIRIEYDADAGSLEFFKNDVSEGTAFTGIDTNEEWFFAICTNNSTTDVDFGQLGFVGETVTSGFKALCTGNLPAPAITVPTDYFNTKIFTGTGAENALTFGGINAMQPDLVWIKDRDTAVEHVLTDAVRGATKELNSDGTLAETTVAQGLKSFDADGFTLGTDGNYNTSSSLNVAWNWKANGAGSSNTDGSITSTVSANTTAGFSIVTYTGIGTAGTVGHGLGAAPKMILVKARSSAQAWRVHHNSLAITEYLVLNTTAAQESVGASDGFTWNTTTPDSTAFVLGGTGWAVNDSSVNYVAYCFAEIEGFSSFGTYTGNGSADGPFVHCGFRPAFVMIKCSSNAVSWVIQDEVRNDGNPADNGLYPDLTNAESVSNGLDLLSNGFKCRATDTSTNGSAYTYIFAAFAEHPFGGDGVSQARAR